MTKTILNMVLKSKFRLLYLAVFIVLATFINIQIYGNPLNFSILLFISFVAIYVSLVLSYEIYIHEQGVQWFEYFKTLKGENYIMWYRTKSIFIITVPITVLSSIIMNTIYFKHIFVSQQITYLILIIISTFFYIHFVQFILLNISSVIIRNTIISSVTIIAMLSLFTKNIPSYLMFLNVLGLFLAITFMNRRLADQLRREKSSEEHQKSSFK